MIRTTSSQLILLLLIIAGAGKSTLLDVLSGYRKTGVTGSVYVNGRIRNLGIYFYYPLSIVACVSNSNFHFIVDTFRKMSCYITQDDRIQHLLTVLENMRIASDFKLGDQLKHHEKEARVRAKYTLDLDMNDENLESFQNFIISDRGNINGTGIVGASNDIVWSIIRRPEKTTINSSRVN